MNAPETFVIPETLYDRLKNWAIASRLPAFLADTCGSMEKRYRSPQVWYAPQPKLVIDYLDADLVEKAWRSLPMKHRMMLKYCYVYPVHPRVAERKARITVGSYQDAKRLAEFKIAVVLAR